MRTLARERDRSELLRRLRRLRPESERRWGRMSAHQMVCHVNDCFLMMAGRRPVSHASSWLGRTVVKWVALYAPLPWPAGILTSPELDQTVGGTTPGDFASELAQLEAFIASLAAQREAFDAHQHPVFGRMSISAWLRWAYLHTDHHLRQFGV